MLFHIKKALLLLALLGQTVKVGVTTVIAPL